MNLYPLKFKPRFVEKIWGGRKLESVLGKTLPPEIAIGESWEIFHFPPGVIEKTESWESSIVANGPLAGESLHDLIHKHGSELMGDVKLTQHGQFPVLIKFLDAREDLSIQVHPDAEYARKNLGAHLKTEAWYIVQHDESSRIYKGTQPGVTRESFRQAIAAGQVEEMMRSIEVKEGQCHFLPSGTVHALGAGILAAEVQTPSDTTYRVYDFNRIDASTGKTRALHIEQSLECIDFSGKEVEQKRSHTAGYFTTVTRLVTSEFFMIEKVRFIEGVEQPIPYDQPVVWMMLQGKAEVKVDGVREAIQITRGETVLLPAKMNNAELKTLSDCVWLEITFPI